MKYAYNKCLRVIHEIELKDCLKVSVHSGVPGGGTEILLCRDCKPDFWAAVDSDTTTGEREKEYGKS